MSTTFKATIAGLLSYSIFGFSFLFSKSALDVASPFVLLTFRFLAAFLILNMILLTGKMPLSLKGKPVVPLFLMGLVQPVIYFICETYGIALTTASFSGVILGLAPIAGLVFGALFLKEKCTIFQVFCTAMSVLGVILTTTGGFGTFSMAGFFLLMGSVISAALFTVLSRSISAQFSPFERTYVMTGMGLFAFAGIAFIQNLNNPTAWITPLSVPAFWTAVCYLAALSSVCSFLLLNYAVNHLSAGRTLIMSNFTTVISVLAGIFIMHDTFSSVQLIGITIIVLSVFGVSMKKKETA